MAFSEDRINKLKEAGLTDEEIKRLEIVLEGTATGSGSILSGTTLESEKQRLENMKESLRLLKEEDNYLESMKYKLQDHSIITDRINDSRNRQLKYAEDSYEIAKKELEIAINSGDADAKKLDDLKSEVILRKRSIKSIKQAEMMQKQLNAAGDRFVGTLGLADGKLGGIIDNLDISAVNFKEMGRSAAGFAANLAGAFTPMKILTSMITKAVETFTRVDEAQFEVFQQTGIKNAADDFAALSEGTTAFLQGGHEMKNALVGLTQELSIFGSMSGEARTELGKTVMVLEGLGVSSTESAAAMSFMIQTLGQSPALAEENTRKFATLAEELGRPPQEIISNFSRMAGSLAKHGPAMQNQFMKLQAVATSTGMSVESLVDVTSAFDTFEEGASKVGMLNAILGGPYLDTLTMISGDETTRLLELRGALERNGENFETMSRARRQAIAQEMGMNVDELGKFMSMSESAMKAEMKRTELAAKERKELENNFQNAMTLMQKITIALQEAMREVFGPDTFDSKNLDSVKAVFVGVLEAVKGIASIIGSINSGLKEIGLSPGMAALGTIATVGGGTLLAKKGMAASAPLISSLFKSGGRFLGGTKAGKLLGKIPGAGKLLGAAGGAADAAAAATANKVYVVGGTIEVSNLSMLSGLGGGGTDLLPDAGKKGKGFFSKAKGFLGKGFSAVGNFGKSIAGKATALGSGAVSMAKSGAGALGRFGGRVGRGAVNLGSRAIRGAASMGKSALQGAANLADDAAVAVANTAAAAKDSVISKAMEAIKPVGGKIAAGFTKILGPLMATITASMKVMDIRDKARAEQNPNLVNVGRETIKAISYPFANLALNFIPGVGTGLSIADGLLSAVGMSPMKFLTDNLIDILPDGIFPQVGGLVVGDRAAPTIEGPSAKSPTFENDFQFYSSATGAAIKANSSDVAEGVSVKEGGVLAKKLDKLISLMSDGGNKEIVIQIDRKEIARAAISGINNDFYGFETRNLVN